MWQRWWDERDRRFLMLGVAQDARVRSRMREPKWCVSGALRAPGPRRPRRHARRGACASMTTGIFVDDERDRLPASGRLRGREQRIRLALEAFLKQQSQSRRRHTRRCAPPRSSSSPPAPRPTPAATAAPRSGCGARRSRSSPTTPPSARRSGPSTSGRFSPADQPSWRGAADRRGLRGPCHGRGTRPGPARVGPGARSRRRRCRRRDSACRRHWNTMAPTDPRGAADIEDSCSRSRSSGSSTCRRRHSSRSICSSSCTEAASRQPVHHRLVPAGVQAWSASFTAVAVGTLAGGLLLADGALRQRTTTVTATARRGPRQADRHVPRGARFSLHSP